MSPAASDRARRGWGLFEWSAVATSFGAFLSVITLVITHGNSSETSSIPNSAAQASASDSSSSLRPSPNSTLPSTEAAPRATIPATLGAEVSSPPVPVNIGDGNNSGLVVQTRGFMNDGNVSVNGKIVETAFVLHCYVSVTGACTNNLGVDVNLGRRYSTFKARIGSVDNSAAGKTGRVQILLDGRTLFDKKVSLGVSYDVVLPVKGGLRLAILGSAVGEGLNVAVGDPLLTP